MPHPLGPMRATTSPSAIEKLTLESIGTHAAASKPADLHEIYYAGHLHFNAKKTQKDVIVRVTSDSLWFNQQVCRYAWRKLAGRIDKNSATLDCGYSNPNGRSRNR